MPSATNAGCAAASHYTGGGTGEQAIELGASLFDGLAWCGGISRCSAEASLLTHTRCGDLILTDLTASACCYSRWTVLRENTPVPGPGCYCLRAGLACHQTQASQHTRRRTRLPRAAPPHHPSRPCGSGGSSPTSFGGTAARRSCARARYHAIATPAVTAAWQCGCCNCSASRPTTTARWVGGWGGRRAWIGVLGFECQRRSQQPASRGPGSRWGQQQCFW